MITLELPYPVSTNVYWRTFRNIQIISKAGKAFKKEVWATYCTKIKPSDFSYKASVTLHPKLSKAGKAHKRIIDIDNCFKCILDSLIGIVYHDDKQVKMINASYGDPKINGGATVIIERIENEICSI